LQHPALWLKGDRRDSGHFSSKTAMNEAHDMIMGVFGGLSKGERNRVKLRVHAAMAAITATEGRFLGGRPPYGYVLIDAGPHPNPSKAADGRRLRRLEPDPNRVGQVRGPGHPDQPALHRAASVEQAAQG
jgi:hypothetical protein